MVSLPRLYPRCTRVHSPRGARVVAGSCGVHRLGFRDSCLKCNRGFNRLLTTQPRVTWRVVVVGIRHLLVSLWLECDLLLLLLLLLRRRRRLLERAASARAAPPAQPARAPRTACITTKSNRRFQLGFDQASYNPGVSLGVQWGLNTHLRSRPTRPRRRACPLPLPPPPPPPPRPSRVAPPPPTWPPASVCFTRWARTQVVAPLVV